MLLLQMWCLVCLLAATAVRGSASGEDLNAIDVNPPTPAPTAINPATPRCFEVSDPASAQRRSLASFDCRASCPASCCSSNLNTQAFHAKGKCIRRSHAHLPGVNVFHISHLPEHVCVQYVNDGPSAGACAKKILNPRNHYDCEAPVLVSASQVVNICCFAC